MDTLTLVIIAGLLAVLYGIVQTASLMKASPGNERMQEIAAAISCMRSLPGDAFISEAVWTMP